MIPKLKNIVVATIENIGYYKILVESCKRNNIDLVVLGKNKEWTGFTMRFALWLDYLNNLNDNEIVMINDAYDVIIIENGSTIINRFLKLNKNIVVGSQDSTLSRCLFHNNSNSVMCCGNIIGYVKHLKIFINIMLSNQHLWTQFNNDDQLLINYLFSKEKFMKNNMYIDVNKDIFFIASDDNKFNNIDYILYGYINNLKMYNRKLYTNDNKYICVLHLPADMNGNLYLNYLGYDTSDVKLTTFKMYKFYQVYGILKYNLSFLIVFLIILFVITFVVQVHSQIQV